MKPPLLPPENLWLSLPAITADEAEMILNLVDELRRLLREAYGDAIFDNLAANQKSTSSPPARQRRPRFLATRGTRPVPPPPPQRHQA